MQTDATPSNRSRYTDELAARRDAAHLGQLVGFGLTVGWVCLLLGGFCWLCVISRWDWLWCILTWTGLALVSLAVLLPDALAGPCRIWMRLAQVQGRLVMSALLAVIYFALITPVGAMTRWRRGTHPFHSWSSGSGPADRTGWEPIVAQHERLSQPRTDGRRSLPTLLLATIGFFRERAHISTIPIVIVLLVLGMILFFVQGSAIAPFIYTLF